MRPLKVAAGMTTGLLVLSGCAAAVFSTDGGCGVIAPVVTYPSIYGSQGTTEDTLRIQTDLAWEIDDVPEGVDEVFTGAVTTFPFSEIVATGFEEDGFAVTSAGQTQYHVIANYLEELTLATEVAPFLYQQTEHDILNSDAFGALPMFSPSALALGVSLFSHFPVAIVSSCDSDYRPALEAVMDETVSPDDGDEASIAQLQGASSTVVYPGYQPNLINFQLDPEGIAFAVSSNVEGWTPATTAISAWSDDFLSSENGGPDLDSLQLSAMDKDWAATWLLLQSQFLSSPDPNQPQQPQQPLTWTTELALQGEEDDDVELVGGEIMVVNLDAPITLELIADSVDSQLGDSSNFEHFVVYTAFVKLPEDGSSDFPEIAYSFERLRANQDGEITRFSAARSDVPMLVSQVSDSEPHQEILSALFDEAGQASFPEINGLNAPDYAALDDAEQILHKNFGTFSEGSSLVGLDSGLVITPGYSPESLMLDRQGKTSSDMGYFQTDAGQSLTTNAQSYPDSVVGALASSMSRDLEDFFLFGPSSQGFQVLNNDPPEVPIVETTTLSFVLNPTADFFKMDFVLGMTEYGEWNPDTGKWTDYISEFPDGLGIFVKSENESWLDATNCAAIPTTNTYLSMPAAGILPPGNPSANSVLAQQNYLELVKQTATPGYATSPGARVGIDLTESVDGLIPPPMIALATEQDSAVRFVTTVMTCVVDISEIRSGQERVEIGLAVANTRDDIFPPAMFVSNGSIRFAQTAVAVQEVKEQVVVDLLSQDQPVVAPYSGPVITSGPVTSAPGGQALLTGSGLETVTTVEVNGRTIAVDSASEQQLRFTLPLDMTLGTKDLVLISSFGRLSLPGMLRVVATVPGSTGAEPTASIKRIGDTVRLFATDVIGAGKVQLMLNGREIAWVRAVDNTDPKLRFSNGAYYLVRTIELAEGKNVFEVLVDGERVRRVAYSR